MKGSGAHYPKQSPLPTQPTNARKQMQRKYYTMRRSSFQAMSDSP